MPLRNDGTGEILTPLHLLELAAKHDGEVWIGEHEYESLVERGVIAALEYKGLISVTPDGALGAHFGCALTTDGYSWLGLVAPITLFQRVINFIDHVWKKMKAG